MNAMKTLTKALTGTIAAGAMAISSATPAFAEHRDRNGISAGDVIAGALIIGGIAAVASAASKNDRNRDYRGYPGEYGYDRAGYSDNYGGHYGNNYDRDARWRGNPRSAVEQCVYAAERYASGRGLRADVTDIREVRDTRYGFEVKGRIAVKERGRGWNRGDSNYGQGWGGDYRGWNQSMRGYDSGRFKCKFERGRIVDLDIDGIRGF
jgi:hypothetical protein